MSFLSQINWSLMMKAIQETLYMTIISLLFSILLGLVIGLILFITQKDSLYPQRYIFMILNLCVNILRAIPFIILLICLMPVTKLLVGRILGAKAALPALICSASPFYARMCMIALTEVDKGTIEASKAMGATNWQIITKVLLPEAKPALISGIA